MSADELGRVRRSQIIMTHGPGAIVDFRAGGHGGAAVSIVAAGLEEWDRSAPPAGLANLQRLSEPRLEKILGVRGFRLPPVSEETRPGQKPKADRPVLPGIRFPAWLTCPQCNLLQPVRRWTEDQGDPAPYCRKCSDEQKRRVHVIPVRFVLACENGHLDEFPWHTWVPHEPACRKIKPLRIDGQGAGLKGLVVSCTACGKSRSMDGAFSPHAMRELDVCCSGRRPWLSGEAERCFGKPPSVVQRGASNLYFAAIESALSIPPWDDELQAAIGEYWAQIVSAATAEDRAKVVELVVMPIWEGPETLAELQQQIDGRIALLNAQAPDMLRFQEYQKLKTTKNSLDEKSELSLRFEPLTAGIASHIGHITQVSRLREVRALWGFSRIHPPSGPMGKADVTPLSRTPKHWLPAVEVRGEGIFLTLEEERLRTWEARDQVRRRAELLDQQNRRELLERLGDNAEPRFPVTARYVLLHTLSHLLMRELALECGYSTSSLRERLYVDAGESGMCGVLIFTATSDADGTLGGLVQQGRPDRMEALLRSAVDAARWCSSDPLCMTGVVSLSNGLNGAACHSCTLAPETSCETFNHFLDRALIVGLPDDELLPEDRRVGYFSDLMPL